MLGIWSITKHTLAQCLRMKLAATFAVLLAIMLAALPMQMTGDGTLAGQIRAFLAYGTGIALGLLSVMTVFVGASLVSTDIRTKQIFSVAVKPLARWQYIVGRWVGLVLFNAMLLAFACTAIYSTARYLRTKKTTEMGPVSSRDRGAVETEIFASRRKIKPDPIDLRQTVAQQIKAMQDAETYDAALKKFIDQADGNPDLAAELLKRDLERRIIAQKSDPLALDSAVDAKIAALKKNGTYKTALEGWMPRANDDPKEAHRLLRNQLRRQIGGKMQSIAPGGTMTWGFSGINVTGRETRQKAHVTIGMDRAGLMQFRMPERFACRLRPGLLVKVNGVETRVAGTNEQLAVVRVPMNRASRDKLSQLTAGDTVELTTQPLLQISYVLTPANDDLLPLGKFQGRWQVTGSARPTLAWPKLPETTRQKVTLSVTPELVGKDGKLQFAIHNASRTSVEVLFKDVTLMYDVDSFENNFLRASVLMLCQLAYLSAVSILAGSFVSFPVACLLCSVLGPFSLAREFLVTSTRLDMGDNVGFLTWLAHYIYLPFYTLLPDFARTMPGDRLVDGANISWAFVGDTAVADVVIRAGVALLLACLVFHRRELARVQV